MEQRWFGDAASRVYKYIPWYTHLSKPWYTPIANG